jgi:GNAT superfamily N-acetyltransferase
MVPLSRLKRKRRSGGDLMQDLSHDTVVQAHIQRQQNDAQNTVVSPDDATVSIRAATPGDKEGLRRMFSRLSSKTIYRRFHLPYLNVPERTLALMSDGDHHDKEILLAVVGEEVVGHAMYVLSDNERDAEVAFVVEDRWQSKGVGKLLLARIAGRARSRGVEYFTGDVLGENGRVLGLLNAVFGEVRYVIGDSLYHFRAPLRTLRPATDLAPALRGAA